MRLLFNPLVTALCEAVTAGVLSKSTLGPTLSVRAHIYLKSLWMAETRSVLLLTAKKKQKQQNLEEFPE